MVTISGRELQVAWARKPVLPGRVRMPGKCVPGLECTSFRKIIANEPIKSRGKRGWSQDRNAIVTRAFLGVGAPEAVLVGVVALVLFGPKGLAQAAKSLGQGVKAIAPTLKELTDISSDLKSTIEDEIGLNEIRNELESTLSPATKPRPTRNATVLTDDEDPDIVSKREESAKIAWSVGETSPSIGQEDDRNIDSMSVEELEAEILRRKSSGPLES